MDKQLAYHYLLALQMAQQNDNSHPTPYANYQQHVSQPQQPQQPPPPNRPNDGRTDYPFTHAPQPRSTPMRLDLPPPPVFATEVTNDYPNQYGPSTLLYSPYGENPPNNILHAQDATSQMYPPSYTPGGFQPPPPTSPYPVQPTPTYPSGPGPLYYQQQQPQAPQHQHQAQLSPYYAPYTQTHVLTASSNGSNESAPMSEYFPPYSDSTLAHQQPQQQQYQPPSQQHQAFISPPLPSPTWPTAPSTALKTPGSRPEPASAAGSSQSAGSGHGPKTSRQQFTACGACRHRRVKCDLKDKQEQLDRQDAIADAQRGVGPVRTDSATRRKRIICTNCQDRGMNCVYVLTEELN